ncbi:MAG: BTAD domain-containing putative transcriptional regulator, partial [Leifsonia sp.]
MGIDVLGPLTVDGGSLSPKERAVLAALVLKYGQGATTDELADACWGERLPSTWRKQLQALIVGNRRILGADAIATIPSGYSLTVSPDTIDAARFERLVSRAAEHFANAEPDRGVDALENALRLWRGTAYPELSSWDAAVAESARLDDLRKASEEDLLDGRLACGEHRSVVPDAELLVREESLRERRWAILATALYRAGRQADALAALREARRRLDEDLGIEPGRELEDLERGILQHDPSLDAPPPPDRTRSDCPYKGLACFEADDEELFFGRGAETSAALSRLDRTSFLAFSGASGSGKSSLVLAGVVPALRRAGRSVVVVTPVPPASTRLRDAVTRMPRAGTIVVDQFEEVFGADQHADTARECCALLADVVAAGGTVILTVRSDFLDDCAADPRLAPLLASDVQIVGPMSREALREAIVEPARVTGLRLENGLAELVMRDAAGEAGLLPLMSHALVETWLLRDGATLTIEAYEQAGGLGAALASTAERVYTSLDDEERAACRSLLLRLVVLGVEGSPVRRRAHLRPLREDPVRSGIIGRFVQARLLTASDDTVTLTHESLATAWPRLRTWLDEDAQNARVMEQVTAASEAWEADGEPAEDLYRGARLETALEWRASASPDLTGTEARFLDASAARDRAETDAAAARARRDARQNRTLRGLLTGAGALLVASVAATVFAIDSGTQATRQGASANVEALVGTSLALRASQRDVAALLAVEAHRRWPEDPRPLSALLGTF